MGQSEHVAIGREERRGERRPSVDAAFPADAVEPALDVFELMDLAWHDCYDALEPPAAAFADVMLLADGDLGALARLALAAVVDFRDVRVAADAKRA